jgi:hypothetical protein
MCTSPASHRGGPGPLPRQFMWDLWWTKWHWDRVFSQRFDFPLSISFHQCSILIFLSFCHLRYIIRAIQNTFLCHSKHTTSADHPVNAVLRNICWAHDGSYVNNIHSLGKRQNFETLMQVVQNTVIADLTFESQWLLYVRVSLDLRVKLTACLRHLYGSQNNQQLFPYIALAKKLNNIICTTYITGIMKRSVCEWSHGRGRYGVVITNKWKKKTNTTCEDYIYRDTPPPIHARTHKHIYAHMYVRTHVMLKCV